MVSSREKKRSKTTLLFLHRDGKRKEGTQEKRSCFSTGPHFIFIRYTFAYHAFGSAAEGREKAKARKLVEKRYMTVSQTHISANINNNRKKTIQLYFLL